MIPRFPGEKSGLMVCCIHEGVGKGFFNLLVLGWARVLEESFKRTPTRRCDGTIPKLLRPSWSWHRRMLGGKRAGTPKGDL